MGSFTPEELRLLALSDAITQWDEDEAREIRAREVMAKARAAKAAKAILECPERLAAREALALQRAQDRQRRYLLRLERQEAERLKPPDIRLTWADRTILAALPATIDDLDRRFQGLQATKVPRVIEGRLQRLEALGLAFREPIAEGSAGVSDVRWTPTEAAVRKDRCA